VLKGRKDVGRVDMIVETEELNKKKRRKTVEGSEFRKSQYASEQCRNAPR